MEALSGPPAFVLCGGASRRMGRDKAFMAVDGLPLAQRTARVLAAAGCHPVTLVGKRPELTGLGLPVLLEPEPGYHPLWGVALALEQIEGTAVLAAVDLVGLTPEAVVALQPGPSIATCCGRDQPLLCALPASLAARARALAQAGGSVMALVEGLPRVELGPAALVNANTLTDLGHLGPPLGGG